MKNYSEQKIKLYALDPNQSNSPGFKPSIHRHSEI
jgi:hypothetical protein